MPSLRQTLRQLARSPGFTAIALITVALGVGVNTSMFSVVRAFLLTPAPYPAGERLVRIYRTSPHTKSGPHAAPVLADLRETSRAYTSVAAFHWWTFSLSEPGQPPDRLQGLVVSEEFFRTIGVQPALGRAFTTEEQQPGKDRVVILTDALWRSRFAADPGIVGKTLRVDGTSQTVVGVMPPEFAYPLLWGRLDALRPLVLAAAWQSNRGEHWLNAIARLQPGVTLAEAEAEGAAIGARWARQHPDSDAGTSLRIASLQHTTLDATRRTVSWLMFGLAAFVLLIACANLANLQIARSAARTRDLALRAALGASRRQLLQSLGLESLLVAFAGGTAGVVLATWLNGWLSQHLQMVEAVSLPIPLDGTALLFAVTASGAAGFISALIPGWFATRVDLNVALQRQSHGSTGDRSRRRLRHGLIVAEFAFAVMLLAGAAYFIRGLQRFTARDPGWQPTGLVTGTITLPKNLPTDRYRDPEVRRTFYDQLLQRLSSLPGVDHAALASSLPVTAYRSARGIAIDGHVDPPRGQEPLADYTLVAGDFFAALGLPLLEGRRFPEPMPVDGPRFVVIGETLARRFWPHESALGKRLGSTDSNARQWAEVIGVVRDAGFVANLGVNETPYQMYAPLVQEPWGYLAIAVRAASPETLAEPIRRAVAELDPDLPVAQLQTVAQAVDHAQHNLRVMNRLLASFAVLGVLLAAIGLYGVISTLVTQRTREFGIRLAVGAQRRDILRLVLGKCVGLTAAGSAIGLGGAGALLQGLGRLLPGLRGSDPLALATIVGILLVVALLACWLPARRATRVDPLVALRTE